MDLSPVFAPPLRPSRRILIWRAVLIAFALLLASGVWDVLWLTQLTWLVAFWGLGARTIAPRIAGAVLAAAVGVYVTGGLPASTPYGMGTPEELAHNLRFARILIIGVLVGAVVGWIAAATRPRLRAWAERLEERRA